MKFADPKNNDTDKHNWTKDELASYDYLLMREQDERGRVEFAEEKAKKLKSLEIGKELKRDGVNPDKISKYTGLSIEEIKNL